MFGGRATDQRGRIAGRVVDEAGRPIEEAQVFLVAGPSHPDIAAITGPDGRFALGGLLPGRYRLQAGAAGYESAMKRVVVTASGRAQVEIELFGLDPGDDDNLDQIPGDVAGRVVDEAGRPIQEARVFLIAGPSYPDIVGVTGPDGRFTIDSLLPGRYRLQAEAVGYGPTAIEVVVTSGGRAQVEIELSGSGRDGNGSGSSDPYAADEIPGDDEYIRERAPG